MRTSMNFNDRFQVQLSIVFCLQIMKTRRLQHSTIALTRIILRPLSALSLDEVNIAKRNITTGLFGLQLRMNNFLPKHE
jgi:hypothetical protein